MLVLEVEGAPRRETLGSFLLRARRSCKQCKVHLAVGSTRNRVVSPEATPTWTAVHRCMTRQQTEVLQGVNFHALPERKKAALSSRRRWCIGPTREVPRANGRPLVLVEQCVLTVSGLIRQLRRSCSLHQKELKTCLLFSGLFWAQRFVTDASALQPGVCQNAMVTTWLKEGGDSLRSRPCCTEEQHVTQRPWG